MKKLISLVLALAMIMVVGAAFATQPTAESNTIEITNAVNGETYKAYKMLDLSYSGDDGSGNPVDRKSTRLNSSHPTTSRMPSSA